MATLVLSTVGTILGGPVGGAIGSLLGQSIDQQLFGPGPRQGPRIGDLAVQSSTYGTAIPKLFGTIRVAGSIIWSTDLKEDAQTQGAKGQPDSVTYSYSVSFAVALSSRRISQIRRIWADGKLLRGAAGDFKVSTGFRFHPGTEDQPVDPLIGSVEGVAATPAYRGLALAVFENLQLAEYGNRIPFLTFEVEADPAPPTIGEVLDAASGGAIACSAPALLPGYAAHGGSIEAAVQPLVEHFGIELFDDGMALRSPTAVTVAAEEEQLGCSASGEAAPRRQRSQTAARSLPSVLTLSYYDPDRDYQTAQMRASTSAPFAVQRAEQLAAVLTTQAAKALTQNSLARYWAQRDTLTLRLPPEHIDLEPGMLVKPPGEAEAWSVVRVTIDGLAVVAELRPVVGGVDILPADSGRSLPAKDAVAASTTVSLMEFPASYESKDDTPVIVVASTSTAAAARPVPLEVKVGSSVRSAPIPSRQAVLGRAVTTLEAGQSALLDLGSSVEVELVNAEQWLQSCDDDLLIAGGNLAMIGSELIQYGSAVALGGGRFRLSRLLRGRRGTEWATGLHAVGDTFLLIDTHSLDRIDVSAAEIGAMIRATPHGLADSPAQAVSLVVGGEAMRPPSPVHLKVQTDGAGSLDCSWSRRSRLGWAWTDGIDTPVGAARELYRLRLQGSSSALELETAIEEASFTAAQLASVGPGPITLSVVQVGDFGVSRPATLIIS